MKMLRAAALVSCILLAGCSINKVATARSTCGADCCTCKTGCCYIEATGGIKVGGCFEYTGPAGKVKQFLNACSGKQSAPTAYAAGLPKDGECTAGPVTGVPCVAGSTINAVKIPDDSSCRCQ